MSERRPSGNAAATWTARWCALGLVVGLVGCERAPSTLRTTLASAPELPLSRSAATALSVAEQSWSHLPVPPPDAGHVSPTTLASSVWATPEAGSTPIGYLRLGQKVPRSERPVRREGCKGGWYAIAPLGFVCDGEGFTTDLNSPLVRAFPKGPDRTKPLPYKYAFVRSVAPNYLRIPTDEEQHRYEMRLDRHLGSYSRLSKEWDKITPGANEVVRSPSEPFEQGSSSFVQVPNLSERYGGDGTDEVPFWLSSGRTIPNVSTFRAPPYAVMAGRVKRHAGVALVDSFIARDQGKARRFALSVDGRLIPADKLKADTGSAFHGYELGQTTLPVAFVVEERLRGRESGDSGTNEELGFRTLVPLSGDVRNQSGERLVKTRDGAWLRASDLKIAPAPSTLPWFAKRGTRWIDISLLSQTLVLYEGATPKYVTLISSGRDGIGDPKTTLSTPTGTFRIYQKHVTTTMDSSVADSEFELRDVPWVMYFQGGYALHAAYWHDDFGRPRSHGCVNLSPTDARYIFNWTTPDVPLSWHGAYAGDAMGKGTLVHIHP